MIQSPLCSPESKAFWDPIHLICLKGAGRILNDFLTFFSEVNRYFTSSGVIYERSEDVEGNSSTVIIYPKRTTLRHRLQLPCNEQLTDDEAKFLDFVSWMLQLDPEKRPFAGQALLHPWFDDVDQHDVSYVDT